jgi:HEAT repeat protein
LPLELQSVSIEDLPDAAQRLLQDTQVNLRDTLIGQLVWAVKSIDDDTRSRAWIALVSLGRAAIMPIAEHLLQKHQDTGYRLRLIRVLGEIGQSHREAMGPLMHLLSSTKVPELLGAARLALMRVNAPMSPSS